MAVATDCNPGTSPTTSLLLMLNMACTLFRLTPQEALAGVTHVAARALGLADRGTLRAGMRADIAVWEIDEPAELAYRIGGNPCLGIAARGRAPLPERTMNLWELSARRLAAGHRRAARGNARAGRDRGAPDRRGARGARHRLARREALRVRARTRARR